MDDERGMRAARYLREAAKAIREAATSYDAGGKLCTCCGVQVANNLEERNMSNQLGTMIRKLEDQATAREQLHDRRKRYRRVKVMADDGTNTRKYGDRRRGWPGGPE